MTTTKIHSRAGCALQLLGRWGVQAVWARRLADNALRKYSHADLIHDDSATALMLEIGALPGLKPKGAERLLVKAIAAEGVPSSVTADPVHIAYNTSGNTPMSEQRRADINNALDSLAAEMTAKGFADVKVNHV